MGRRKYWLGVAVRDHVMRGVTEGFAQLGHGKESAIRALSQGDWLIYYASRTAWDGGDPVRAFVAIGQVLTREPYPADQGQGFHPWRHDMRYLDAREVPIRPLLEHLDMTRGRGRHWGMAVRGSRHALTAADARTISSAMGVGEKI